MSTDLVEPQATRHHAMGWRRPLPGRGALESLPHANVDGVKVLDEVDPRPKMPPALDQGNLGSCTANATNRAFRFDTIQDGKDCGELSRLWTYYWERALEHTLGQGDCGAEGHDAYTVAKHGIPDENLWPYIVDAQNRFEVRPGNIEPRAYTLKKAVNALPYDEASIKAALSAGQTVTYGFTVYQSFEEAWAKKGVMPMPKAGEEVLGGHENLICGYLKDYPGFLLSLNSWSASWGIDGYFLIPIKFVLDSLNASDFRTIVRPIK